VWEKEQKRTLPHACGPRAANAERASSQPNFSRISRIRLKASAGHTEQNPFLPIRVHPQ
jgi:hypothetical protein